MFPVHTHLKMLADQARIGVYKKGIFNNVRTGDIVADVGTGTGILAFFALQAGARRVYALESGPIIENARKIAAANGFEDRIVFIRSDSCKARLPEKVDVLITETFGGLGFDEGALAILADARDRFLKPGGVILPERMNLRAVPVYFESGHPFKGIETPFHDLDMGPLLELAANTYYGLGGADLEKCIPAGGSAALYTTAFSSCKPLAFPLKMAAETAVLERAGYDGVVVYPELLFPGGASLALFDGLHFVPTHWELIFFPIQPSLRIEPGDGLGFHLSVTRNNGLVWKHVWKRKGKETVFSGFSAFGLPSLQGLRSP